MFDEFANLMMPVKKVPTALRALGQLLTEGDVKHILDEFSEEGKGETESLIDVFTSLS